MILPAQELRRIRPVTPFCERTMHNGMTFGLGPAGYDVRVAEGITVSAGQFLLASTVEHFNIPNDILGKVCDKSTWARRGIAVQNTIIEPGWRGFLTLELTNHGRDRIVIEAGDPIAQIIFFRLEAATELPHAGKYQDREAGPQPARREPSVGSLRPDDPTPQRRLSDWKYSEGRILCELESYLASTYGQHYVGEDNVQVMDLIGSMGHGRSFAIGNIIKYASRQGKKRGQERADILKILHYAIFLLHFQDIEIVTTQEAAIALGQAPNDGGCCDGGRPVWP